MLVASFVTPIPLALTGPTLLRLTVSPSGSLHPARLARFVIAICQVEPRVRIFVKVVAMNGGRSLVTITYRSLLATPNETNWSGTTPPPPTVTDGRPAPDTDPPDPADMSL